MAPASPFCQPVHFHFFFPPFPSLSLSLPSDIQISNPHFCTSLLVPEALAADGQTSSFREKGVPAWPPDASRVFPATVPPLFSSRGQRFLPTLDALIVAPSFHEWRKNCQRQTVGFADESDVRMMRDLSKKKFVDRICRRKDPREEIIQGFKVRSIEYFSWIERKNERRL